MFWITSFPSDIFHAKGRQRTSQPESTGVARAGRKRMGYTRRMKPAIRTSILVPHRRLLDSLPHNNDNGAQVLSRSQFRHNAPVALVGIQLRRDDVREEPFA